MKLLLVVLSLVSAVLAEDVTLTRVQAVELFVALSTAESGFAPANTIAAADNLNALRPNAEAFDKGKQAYQRAVRALARANPADAQEQAERLAAEVEAKGEEKIAVALVPLNLSDDEIASAKMKPATLAVIRRWLKPATTPTKK